MAAYLRPCRLCQIKPAHLAVENAGVGDVYLRRACGQRLFDRQHHHFFFFLGRDFGFLRGGAAGDGDIVEIDVYGIQSDFGGRLQDLDRDGLITLKLRICQIGSESEIVVFRPGDALGKRCAIAHEKCQHHKSRTAKIRFMDFPQKIISDQFNPFSRSTGRSHTRASAQYG